MKASLRVVSSKEVLEGRVSSRVERAIRRLESGSPEHRGALRAAAALCSRGLRAGLPPSASEAPRAAIELIRDAAAQSRPKSPSLAAVEKQLLASVESAESLVVRAFERTLSPAAECPVPGEEAAWQSFNETADRSFRRYVSLSAHLTLDAHLELVRSLGSPAALIDVIVALASAHSYLTCAAGSLRHASFRVQAFRQASWDASRPTSVALGLGVSELAHQTLHEFLGSKFSSHVVREQAQLEEFFLWAVGA